MRTSTLLAVLALAALATAAQAQERPPMPMKPDFAAALSIPPEKAAQVEAVLQREREKMREVHRETRAELSKILTEEQLARLDELRPRGPRPPMGPPHR